MNDENQRPSVGRIHENSSPVTVKVHVCGTPDAPIASSAPCSSPVITTSPLMASWSCASMKRVLAMTACSRWISWNKKMLSGTESPPSLLILDL